MGKLAPPLSSAITALLGPTNTGKTHRALERMLEHDTGVIGLPLRLLAREVYDRLLQRLDRDEIALVTGEEKRVPRRPRYWVCTVEAMPIDLEVDFVAVDEIQLVEHRQRGHVFTDRLLRARGRLETWFLGSDTMVPLVRDLLPTARITRHPRLSHLSHRGSSSLGALVPRTAIVAFGVEQVYELADAVRRRRGGAAVVLGALSPRARNAQVALYESGEVDYLVATDAIGMGLNLDIDHVALAGLRKFDGNEQRELELAEIGQIVGRAGRFVRDGTFGTLSRLPELPPPVVHALQEHRFPIVRRAWWRNPDPDYSSIHALVASLREQPKQPRLSLVRDAEDLEALLRLGARQDVIRLATGRGPIALLWETCQIPDFRKLLPDAHADLVHGVFSELCRSERLGDDWMRERVERIDDTDGDIATLTDRLAAIRTWTYVSSHATWVEHATHWRDTTRAIEDKLSDALHRRLVQRFVDKDARRSRASSIRGRPRGRRVESWEIDAVDPNHPFAALRKLAARMSEVPSPRPNLTGDLVEAPANALELGEDGVILFEGRAVARLRAGSDVLRPDVVLTADDLASGPHRRSALQRLRAFARDIVRQTAEPLSRAELEALSAAGRGLLYQLERGMGTVLASDAREQVRALSKADRAALSRAGVVVGQRVVYSRPSLRQGAVRRRVALWQAFLGRDTRLDMPRNNARSFFHWAGVDPRIHVAVGYPVMGKRAIRADALEDASALLARAARGGAFTPPQRLGSLLQCRAEELVSVVEALGYRYVGDGRFMPRRGRGRAKRRR